MHPFLSANPKNFYYLLRVLVELSIAPSRHVREREGIVGLESVEMCVLGGVSVAHGGGAAALGAGGTERGGRERGNEGEDD